MSSRATRRARSTPAEPPVLTPVDSMPLHPTIHARAVQGESWKWLAGRVRPTAPRTIWRRAS